MQQTNLRSANAVHSIPLSAYLLLTFGSAWLIWSPFLVAGFKMLRIPKESRKQVIEIGGSSI